ncbi:MAG TPA: ABC transporter permease [Candidatus Bathyarchaeia archaeon]|nr:ABC transporter permease [Candidatus Bathyarchaeia archaeon]
MELLKRRLLVLKGSSNRSRSAALIVHKKKQKHTSRNLKQIFILSKDALTERKTRSALTILMVLVGGGLMVALNAMSAGNTAFINKQLNSLAPNIMFVSSGQHGFHGTTGPPTIIINSQIVNRIKSLPFVQEIVPEYRGTVQLNAQGNIQSASVTAMDPSKLYMIDPNLQLVPGSIIKSTDPTAMVVGNTIAYPPGDPTPFLSVGQTVKATYSYSSTIGKPVTASKTFVVSAVLEPTGNNGIDQGVFINEIEGNQFLEKAGKYDSLVVAARSPDYVNNVQQEITSVYGSNNLGVITPTAILQTRQQFQSGTAAFTLDIAFIALLVGAVGIITTLYTSVNERVKEIGTMKAIGAKPIFILALFLSEAVLIGLLGATSGTLVGIGLAYVLTGVSPHSSSGGGGGGTTPASVSPIFVPSDLLHVWALSLLLSLGAGIMPAWKASRLSPLEALRR